MRKTMIGLCCLFLTVTHAANLLPVHIDTADKAALQRGAKLFMDYCSGCHSLRYLRYNRMAEGLGLTTASGEVDTALLQSNLIYTHATPQDPIQISMPAADARQWFGRVPPDLSLTARERGASWIYTYLNSFYADPKRPFGANNFLVPDVAMPNVLVPLRDNSDMTQQQFEQSLTDVVTFLSYVAEPEKAERHTLGWKVLLFLLVLLILVKKSRPAL